MYSEKELIEGCRQENSICQQIVYERFFPRMMGICLRYSSDRDQAKDMVHEGFIRIFMNFKKFREESSLETWMSRIMVNNAIDMVRSESRNALHYAVEMPDMSDDEHENFFSASEEEPDEDIPSELVMEMVQMLPPGYRAVINLFAIEQCSHKEIAEKLGITEGTSKSQLAKARLFLKKLINKKKPVANER